MANGKNPKTTGEHLIALYGHITGLKRGQEHMHDDLSSLTSKVDKLLYILLAGLLGAILAIVLQ